MIKLADPDIKPEDLQEAINVIKSGNLVQGAIVEKFENSLKKYTQISENIAVSSGTAALHLSLIALGIQPGDYIIVPSFTFPATANVVEIIGAHVLLCDIDPETYCITPENFEQTIINNITKKIKAAIIVHEFGYPAPIKQLLAIAKKYNIAIIEDAACAFGSIIDGHAAGMFSEMACFSFHPRKAITTGEGGLITTTNNQLAAKLRCLRNHGIINVNGKTDFIYAGLNYRLTEIQAAIGLGQINRFNHEIEKRKKLISIYFEKLKNINCLRLPKIHEGHSWQSFMIVLDNFINRDSIITELKNKGIQANLGAQALHELSYFKNKYHFSKNDFPIASELYHQGLVLPLYGKLNEEQILYICDEFIQILKNLNYA